MEQAQDTYSTYYELDFERVRGLYSVRAPLDAMGNLTPVYTMFTVDSGQINTFTTKFYLKTGVQGNPTNLPLHVADITWNPQNPQVAIQTGWQLTDAGRALEPPTMNDQLSPPDGL